MSAISRVEGSGIVRIRCASNGRPFAARPLASGPAASDARSRIAIDDADRGFWKIDTYSDGTPTYRDTRTARQPIGPRILSTGAVHIITVMLAGERWNFRRPRRGR